MFSWFVDQEKIGGIMVFLLNFEAYPFMEAPHTDPAREVCGAASGS